MLEKTGTFCVHSISVTTKRATKLFMNRLFTKTHGKTELLKAKTQKNNMQAIILFHEFAQGML